MASNYFGPLYLTLQLMDVLQASAPSRIVWVNSVGSQLVNPPYLGGNSWAPGEGLGRCWLRRKGGNAAVEDRVVSVRPWPAIHVTMALPAVAAATGPKAYRVGFKSMGHNVRVQDML